MRRSRPLPLLAATVAAAALAACGSTTVPAAGGRGPSTTAPTTTTAVAPTTAVPTTSATASLATASWTTYAHDPQRSGVADPAPPATTLTQAWQVHLDGALYAEPLVERGIVYVATERDTVEALDAATGAVRWVHHLATPVDGSTLQCGNIDPSGVTATPVIDVAAGTIDVLAFEQGAGGPSHHLVRLGLSTGAVRSDQVADVPGLDPALEQERGALLLQGDRVVAAYGGLDGDCGQYKGAVASLPADGSGPVATWVVATARQGGIWAPPGPVAGPGGSILVTTGNAASRSIYDDANAVVALDAGLHPTQLFAPSNWEQLSAADQDLSSTAPSVLTDGRLVVAGKDGMAFLLDGTRLGGVGGQLGAVDACPGSGAYGGSAAAGDVAWLPCLHGLRQVRVAGSAITAGWTAPGHDPGAPVLSGGLLYDLDRSGTLAAIDPATGATRQQVQLASPETSFPGLAAAGGWLFVPAGASLTAFRGA